MPDVTPAPTLQQQTAAAAIAAAYFANHKVPAAAVGDVVRAIGAALQANAEPAPPWFDKSKSVTDGAITCLECGRPFDLLRTHLTRIHRMNAETYRRKHGLPPNYPMVSPNYAGTRSRLAKENGLGLYGRGRPPAPPGTGAPSVTRVGPGVSGLRNQRRGRPPARRNDPTADKA